MAKYAKSLVAVVVAVLTAVGAALTDDTVTDDEKKAIFAAFLTAVLVYFVPNKPASDS